MAIQIKHATTAVGTEAGDGEIGKTEWNEAHTLTLETGKLLGRTTAGAGAVEEVALLDEDDMASDSATSVPTQQSVKAYVDAEVGAIPIGATGVVQYVVFTSSGTFTKASYSTAKAFEVVCIGPGGSGGNASTGGGGSGGGGGGAGGVAIKVFQPSDLAASVSITINTSKAEFTHSTAVVGNAGSNASGQTGGSGGSATGGDINISGQSGINSGDGTAAAGTAGGSTFMGYGIGGQAGVVSSTVVGRPGGNGHGYGGGGGGGGYTTGAGGSGAPGAVIIKVHY